MSDQLDQVKEALTKARREAAKIIIGQDAVIDAALIAIFTNHHALIEGVPGVAKTLLVRTLAKVLGCAFSRIQFTPDLMPADITGTNVFNLKDNDFHLVRGPIFTTFLLADEINRAPAKTQSALLQAMQERRVTIDQETHTLSPSFTVFATQNPIEYEGTYPLPEAQKDRFMLKIIARTPGEQDEFRLARLLLGDDAPEKALDRGVVEPVLNDGELEKVRAGLEAVVVRDELLGYAVQIIRETRQHPGMLAGASPRGLDALLQAARAAAAMDGRDYVTPDDVKQYALPALGHRIVLRPEYEIEGVTVDEVIGQILDKVTVPR